MRLTTTEFPCTDSDKHDVEGMNRGLLFRQLFEKTSSTYTYILGCQKTREAIIIDPVKETAPRDAKLLNELGLSLRWALNTHVHADHITGTGALKQLIPGVKSVISKAGGARADHLIEHGDVIQFGGEEIEVRATPGHTNSCVTYVHHGGRMAFTGDALLIRACGRTDFQEGCPQRLYKSVWEQILSLPEDYSIFVGHNYEGIEQTSVAEEKKFNPRLTKSEEEFVHIMKNLNLSYPKQIDRALPANLVDGELEEKHEAEAK
ncbi:unnamed protein product, partial [Mesorhabditis spiculigera]